MKQYRLLGLARSPGLWLFVLSCAFMVAEYYSGTLFGVASEDSWLARLAFDPSGSVFHLNVLTYSLIHISWGHWMMAAGLWLLASMMFESRMTIRGYRPAFIFLLYGLVNILVALTYRLPFAPLATNADRILGLSSLGLFAVTAGFILRPTWLSGILLLSLGMAFALTSGSELTAWGHGAGFIGGALAGLLIRRPPVARSAF